MHANYESITGRIAGWGKSCDMLYAAIVVGSQARDFHPADRYSDIDLILVVDDPHYFCESDEWLNSIGNFHISFTEDTVGGGRERRVLFDGALDADFILAPKTLIDNNKFFEADGVPAIFANGYLPLVDKINLEEKLGSLAFEKPPYLLLSEKEFINTVNNFWYHCVWAVKKLMRGELWIAIYCLDSYMKRILLNMIEYHAHALHGQEYCTWLMGRLVEEWAEKWIVEKLPGCFAHYEEGDIGRALASTMDLFRLVAMETAEKFSFKYPKETDEYAVTQVNRLQYN